MHYKRKGPAEKGKKENIGSRAKTCFTRMGFACRRWKKDDHQEGCSDRLVPLLGEGGRERHGMECPSFNEGLQLMKPGLGDARSTGGGGTALKDKKRRGNQDRIYLPRGKNKGERKKQISLVSKIDW